MFKYTKLTVERKYLRSQVTRIYHSSQNLDNYDPLTAKQELAKLKTLDIKLNQINVQIQELLWDETKVDTESIYEAELATCDDYNEKLIGAHVALETLTSLIIPLLKLMKM